MASRPEILSLEPPRENVELEDPDTSSEDEFSDAREAIASPTRATTKVERIDDRPVHGEVPRSAAYKKRAEDTRPDVEIKQDYMKEAKHDDQSVSSTGHLSTSPVSSVPMTVITRVDSTPLHSKMPGTEAAALRSADAKPGVIEKEEDVLNVSAVVHSRSPIAADGGFGPMELNENSDHNKKSTLSFSEETREAQRGITGTNDGVPDQDDHDLGDEFDEFAEGEEGDNFDDFTFELEDQPSAKTSSPKRNVPLVGLAHPMLEISPELPTLDNFRVMLSTQLSTLFPVSAALPSSSSETLDSPPEGNTAFLSDRSFSLWQQLIAPPPLQPPNWVRSRIRRLFLVSLGVPVDLDEILPKSKQKKLVLPYNPADQTIKISQKGRESKSAAAPKEPAPRRIRGPPPPPDFDVEEVKILCKKSDADLEEMSDIELKTYVTKLEGLADIGKTVLQYWVKRKEIAVDEKEAFDSVVESLVRHARRVRN